MIFLKKNLNLKGGLVNIKKLKNYIYKISGFSDGFFGFRGKEFHTLPDPDQASGFSGSGRVGFFRVFPLQPLLFREIIFLTI